MKITKLVTDLNTKSVGGVESSESTKGEAINDSFGMREQLISKALFGSGKASIAPVLSAINEFLGSAVNKISLLNGGDNWVYLVNSSWIFRAPKNNAALLANRNENALLKILQGKFGSIAIPKQEYWDQEQGISSYKLIDGKALSCQCYRKMSDGQKIHLAKTLAEFLSSLHSFSLSDNKIAVPKIHDKIRYIIDLTNDSIVEQKIFSHKEQECILSAIIITKKILEKSITKNVLLHGDFHGENLLINKNDNSLSGVIDFSDAKCGPPVFDFCHLYRIDFELAEKIIDIYAQINNLDIAELKTQARAFAVVALSTMVLANKHRMDTQGIRRQVLAGRALTQLLNLKNL